MAEFFSDLKVSGLSIKNIRNVVDSITFQGVSLFMMDTNGVMRINNVFVPTIEDLELLHTGGYKKDNEIKIEPKKLKISRHISFKAKPKITVFEDEDFNTNSFKKSSIKTNKSSLVSDNVVESTRSIKTTPTKNSKLVNSQIFKQPSLFKKVMYIPIKRPDALESNNLILNKIVRRKLQ